MRVGAIPLLRERPRRRLRGHRRLRQGASSSPEFGEILGVHIAGTGASELINEAAVVMRMELTAFEVADMAHAHPTRSEAFMEAVAADALGRCVHLPSRG
ncbi:MAG: hypothetical protein M0C28_37750 [Candidatus Moduliflexus flocculans]|nr:hypothetical protein [Candidatus Moduliflexus flocculans]